MAQITEALTQNGTSKRNPATKPKQASDRAVCEKIGKEVQDIFGRPGKLDSVEALDTVVERLTANTVDKYAPDLRPSLYSRRWLTADLQAQ
ncbi:hypothetical protein N7490_006797 [Penicillium lividum]|nr:hypothetical protein N7490_006797 [Penicillium lividum]